MNRSGEERRQEFETYRQKLTRRCMKWEDEHSDSNMAEHQRPLRRNADTTDLRRLNSYIRRVRAIFRAPTPAPDITFIPRPVTVGTQTWPTTIFRPLKSINSTNKDATAATENTKYTKATTKTTAEMEAIDSQPNTRGRKARLAAKNYNRNKDKWVKTVGFNVVSKIGRYDHATVKRSVILVLNAKPSAPFQ